MYAAHGVGKHPRQRRYYKVKSWCVCRDRACPVFFGGGWRCGKPRLHGKSHEGPRRHVPALYWNPMRPMLRFLWNSTRGHRIAPWRSPYLLWRIETYTGVKMTQIGFLEFWEFLWTERTSLWHFLKWTAEMDRYVHPKSST